MEVVVVEFLVAAKAGWITNQRAPVRFVGEDGRLLFTPIERADGQEVFERSLEPAFTFGGGVLLAQLFGNR